LYTLALSYPQANHDANHHQLASNNTTDWTADIRELVSE